MTGRSCKTRFNNNLRYRAGSHPKQIAITPEYVIKPIRELMGGIELDPCTTKENPLEANVFYYLPKYDGLKEPWYYRSVFVNPPYGDSKNEWVRKAIETSKEYDSKIVLLIPAATDTRIFQNAVKEAASVLFVRGRLKFGILRPNRRQVAASHPSVLIGFNLDLSKLSKLGVVIKCP